MNMTKPTSIALLTLSTLLFASCVSSPKQENKSIEERDSNIEEESTGKIIREPKILTVVDTENEEEKEFKSMLKKIQLRVISSPEKEEVYVGSAFSSPYVVSVTDKNGPVKNFDITVSWPTSRSGGALIYSTASVKTDSDGKIFFNPGLPSVPAKDTITFYPAPPTSSPELTREAMESSVSSPYRVKSKYIKRPGGILFVYDYNEKGNPTTNNFSLLQNLRNAGVNAGNAPVSDSSYFVRPVHDVYRACVNITQGEIKKAANFLVVGTFKWEKPAQEDENETTVTLTANFSCIDMSDGSVKYSSTITESVTDRSKRNAETACRSLLAAKVAEEIIYGM